MLDQDPAGIAGDFATAAADADQVILSTQTGRVHPGVDWVTAHHVSPAVANMSLGGGPSSALGIPTGTANRLLFWSGGL